MTSLILIAETEPETSDALDAYLRRDGFRTACVADGEGAAELHATLKPDLVLLDVRLPKRDGWDVLGEIRRRGDTPVIMISAEGQDAEKLQALRIGADDCIAKPFTPAEVATRVHAILRCGSLSRTSGKIRAGSVEIDPNGYLTTMVGPHGRRRLDLTLTEFRILAHMARFPLRAFTRADLTEICLARHDVVERTVDSHVSKLRKKLTAAGAGALIVSVRGVGYRLDPGA